MKTIILGLLLLLLVMSGCQFSETPTTANTLERIKACEDVGLGAYLIHDGENRITGVACYVTTEAPLMLR